MTKDIVISPIILTLRFTDTTAPRGPKTDKLSLLHILHLINIKALIILAGKMFEGWPRPFLSFGVFSNETISI